MTDRGELIRTERMGGPEGGGMSGSDRAQALVDAQVPLQRAHDIAAITEPLSEPARQEIPTDPTFMRRVALAMLKESLEQGATADMGRALRASGCPPAMYAQMVASPDFWPLYQTLCLNYIVAPRYPRMMQACTQLAMAGEPKHVRMLFEMASLAAAPNTDKLDEMLRNVDEDSFKKILEETMGDIGRLASETAPLDLVKQTALQEEARTALLAAPPKIKAPGEDRRKKKELAE